ncbi:Receptor-like serine/threonine-protein kinase NCRK isoform D [Glycine soja]|uniref:non-specific serine/threonine protein kinase n=2 Tax=Glycine soja TaxID=3848 RepID=A0A445HRN8_GLYSO|nr:Receptor-like serine/threonine-protein kinase NCRK isoform B [Glycine soja]RZB76353.1 Receptor-like serine/threonine-protein kinase NCRK isoform C [Glycine soja]RZB76354.1 Receptor-like serine/threonine-protein kinase NCRK isoform D [Glycine soja]
MKPQLNVAVALVISLLCIQHSFCDEPSDTGLNKWKCRCSSLQGNKIYSLANCSKSCDCHPDAEENASIWTCECDPNGFPKVTADVHNLSCFNACNCTWVDATAVVVWKLPKPPDFSTSLKPFSTLNYEGTVRKPLGSKKQISSKIVVIFLSICVICTTIAFLTSVVCHVYRRDKGPIQSPMISSDKETSYSSTTNLISHRTSSVPETKVAITSPISHITGCFQKAALLFGSQRETFHGNIIQFSFAELENATENFSTSNLIGLGGSSYVYRGRLKDGSNVAVKRIKDQRGPEADSEFFTEIELLSRLHHCHLVPLVGYCSELKGKNVQRLLVFEYMTNGNLRDRLDGILGQKMDWSTRVTIALGAARGLEYLHEAAAPRILHRDVKSTNILLDKNWQAKITDLGMAKNLRADDHPSCSDSPARMQGTFGYFAPEYAIVGRASLESDVFSFGVVLLELISGRQPIHKSAGKEESLVIWATSRLQDSRRALTELADPQLNGNFPEEELQIMAYLAKECLLLDPDTRPTMSEVVQILSSISPGKSRRRRTIPVSPFQEPEDLEKQRQAPPSIFPSRNLLPLDIDHNLHVGNENKDVHTVSSEHLKSLMLFTSKGESWHASDEEMVDLTEPRFESFYMINDNFP